MPITETSFDVTRNHIHLELIVIDANDREYSVDAILDTGAPHTEFSDQFLMFTGFINSLDADVTIKSGLQSQKYKKTVIPAVKICGYTINDFEVYISQFEESWGIDALIGLDFFRMFQVEIDYSCGKIIARSIG